MDYNALHSKLVAAARWIRPSGHVPFGFEQRVLARLRALCPDDAWGYWGRALWKAAAACTALAVALAVWSYASEADAGGVTLETALVSMAEQVSDSW